MVLGLAIRRLRPLRGSLQPKRWLHASWATECQTSACLYDVLGVPPDANQQQIKASYYSAAKAYHPDSATNTRDPQAALKFAAVQGAYEVLSDVARRQRYDAIKAHINRGPAHGAGVVGTMTPRMNTTGRLLACICAIPAVGLVCVVLAIKV